MLVTHPLEPLSAEEIRQAAAIVRRDRGVGDGWRFASVELKEPAKADLPALEPGRRTRREARVVCWNRADGQAYRATVSLTEDEVSSWEHLPGQQPNMTVDEWHECDVMLRSQPSVVEALERRGLLTCPWSCSDMWAYGAAVVPERTRAGGSAGATCGYRGSDKGNPYARHLSGLHPVVDLNTMELLELEDNYAGAPDPEVERRVPPRPPPDARCATSRRCTSPSPTGPRSPWTAPCSAGRTGQLRLGFNYREGLVLHQVSFQDGERRRPVAHRLSFAEMVVPYRDASPDHYRRTAFDIGEWGLGFMTTSLALGCDCLGEITYLDAVVHDAKGEPHDIRTRSASTRRTTACCGSTSTTGPAPRSAGPAAWSSPSTSPWRTTSTSCTGGSTRTAASSARSAPPGSWSPRKPPRRAAARPTGRSSTSGTYAPFHQHFIVARLDLDVDGSDNTVYATESKAAAAGHDDPYGLGLTVNQYAAAQRGGGEAGLRLGHAARLEGRQRQRDQRPGRPGRLQARPGGGVPAAPRPGLARPSSGPRSSATRLWVTPYRADERWPCGEFPEPGGAGHRPSGLDRGRTGRSRTPTSCSGTCSASTTSPAQRTGR